MLRLRPLLGVTLLLTAAAISGGVSLTQALRLGPDYRCADVIDDYEQRRLNDIRPLLSPFTGVEYVRDHPPGEERCAPVGYLTQYFLAPAVVVIDGRRQGRLLVDGRPDVNPVLGSRRQPVLEHDAGNGVRLYRVQEP